MPFHHHPFGSRRSAAIALVSAAAMLAACSGGSPTPSASTAASAPAASATPAPTPEATQTPSASEAAAASETAMPTTVATDIDPCQLVTASEASSLSGASFGTGTESTSGGAKLCTYGGQTNTFTVTVGVAPDEATAQAGETAFVAQLQQVASNGLTLTPLAGFANGADAATLEGTVSAGGASVSISAIYVLRGTTFFGFSDVVLGGSAPSSTDLQAQAMTTLGRLP